MGPISKISNILQATTPSYQETFDVFRMFMEICGLNFFDDNFAVGFINFTRFVVPPVSGLFSVVACIIHLIRYMGDVDSTILSLAAFFSACEVIVKICGMAYKRSKGLKLMSTVLDDRSYEDGPTEKAAFLKYHTLARTLMYITIVSYPFTALMLLSYPAVARKLNEYMLPVGYSIPFISHKQQPWYAINYCIIFVQMTWCALAFVGIDGPFYIYVCYSTCKLEILKSYIGKIGESENIKEQRNLLRKIIRIHTDVLKFSRDCSDFYQEIYLTQVLFSIAHICVSLFHIQLVLINSSYGMLLTNVAKMWIFCYCGELVVTKSNEVSEAMYNNQWYALWHKQDLKAVQFMLANAQRTVGFSIGGFGILSYTTFTEIMKTAYSCNAFLHNMMN
ncbi:odorant receptor 94b-like [Topomyia yanbarensis]|uniref:odorant receptor 94b-like n=1 Tax=Topomyia yanbarensis TaxID=2498891 RepID=UPI00273AE52A|nr:odorant receptor 94b-like [Topomyia yanbarensis]